MTIYFSNPGELDIRLVSTFGVNAKPNTSSPIGSFGTGLKYAIAGVLRLGGTITIETSGTTYTLWAKPTTFRDTTVNMCFIQEEDKDPLPLPFSTDLGKHWEPWMIYREFRCNAVDEGGDERPSRQWPAGADVIFAITCPEVEAVLNLHSTYFLQTKPAQVLPTGLELHMGKSRWIYYKGVAVAQTDLNTLAVYNFTQGLELTEDRVATDYTIKMGLLAGYTRCQEPSVAKMALTTGDGFLERDIPWDWGYNHSTPFLEEAARLAQTSSSSLSPRAARWTRAAIPEARKVLTKPFSCEQAMELEWAKNKWEELFGQPWAWPLAMSLELPEGGLQAFAYANTCYLTDNSFSSRSNLFSCLLEEHIHLHEKVLDCTREFQNAMHKYFQIAIFKEPSA